MSLFFFIRILILFCFVCVSVSRRSTSVQESPRWRSSGDSEAQLDTEEHADTAPALTSTPLKEGYVRLKNVFATWMLVSLKTADCLLLRMSVLNMFVMSPAPSHVSVQRQHREHKESLSDPR